MKLSSVVYRKFEGVVGPENISDQEYILSAYRHPKPGMPPDTISPIAIIMPGSTKEVQMIVTICNQYGIGFVPTLSLTLTAVSDENTVIISLQRMDKILEINIEDRYAIIEAGVRHVHLKPEVMKRGLSYPVPSVGTACSVLANLFFGGDNHVQQSSSKIARYLLGYEWISPDGEIIKVGSLSNNGGWYCPEGPGPSILGLARGYEGWMGAMGVFTRAAIGLDAWKGPKELPVTGRLPSYRVKLPEDRHKVFLIKFPTVDQACNAMIEMGKAEIGQAVLKYFYATAALIATESANDFWELWNSGLFQREVSKAIWVYLAAWSSDELAYEERVMWDIVNENGGEPVDESVRKIYAENMDFFITVSQLQRVLRLGGGWMATKLGGDSINHLLEVSKVIPDYYNEYRDKGILFDAPENFQIIPIEYGHSAHIEFIIFWDFKSSKTQGIRLEFNEKTTESDIKHGHHASFPWPMDDLLKQYGPQYSNYHIWRARLKEAFDPSNVSSPE